MARVVEILAGGMIRGEEYDGGGRVVGKAHMSIMIQGKEKSCHAKEEKQA